MGCFQTVRVFLGQDGVILPVNKGFGSLSEGAVAKRLRETPSAEGVAMQNEQKNRPNGSPLGAVNSCLLPADS